MSVVGNIFFSYLKKTLRIHTLHGQNSSLSFIEAVNQIKHFALIYIEFKLYGMQKKHSTIFFNSSKVDMSDNSFFNAVPISAQ